MRSPTAWHETTERAIPHYPNTPIPTRLRVHCPAKINLFLAVGPRDARGYHPLRTVFQAVDLCDTLEVTFSSAGAPPANPVVEVFGAELPEQNTVTKALRLSQEIFAIGVEGVRLEKRIPTQSGLGGGSSDAAGILRALNHVRAVPLEELEGLAAAIGADVPFFLTGGKARGEGYGERITPLPDEPEQWFVIAKPPIGCSTIEMYERLDERGHEWLDWAEGDTLYNDFETVAPAECKDLIYLLMGAGARGAGLSGSGSAVFGRFGSRAEAERSVRHLEAYGQVWVSKALTRAESLRIENPSN